MFNAIIYICIRYYYGLVMVMVMVILVMLCFLSYIYTSKLLFWYENVHDVNLMVFGVR
jgi:hypothetical protein